MVDRVTDGDLIRASLEDPHVFEEVFERHHGTIFGYLARRVGRDAAGDLASEVFVIAFRQRGTFRRDVEDAAPWLYGIAANLARRHARSAARWRRARSRLGHPGVIWPDPDIEGRLDAQREFGAVADALSRLRAQDREVLLLFALGDLSYEEISQALGIPIGTVRSRLSRARTQMRNRIESTGKQTDTPHGQDGRDDDC